MVNADGKGISLLVVLSRRRPHTLAGNLIRARALVGACEAFGDKRNLVQAKADLRSVRRAAGEAA